MRQIQLTEPGQLILSEYRSNYTYANVVQKARPIINKSKNTELIEQLVQLGDGCYITSATFSLDEYSKRPRSENVTQKLTAIKS